MPDKPAGTRRVFFALWPEPEILGALDDLAASATKSCGGRRVRRDALHMTLLFIGAASPGQIDLLLELANRVRAEPFDLLLDRIGWWPHNRILWAGCHDAPSGQRRLFDSLAKALQATGFNIDQRPWVPHVTLVRNARGDQLPEMPEPILWHLGSFSLVESFLQPSGARYRTLANWRLSESA